MRKQFIRDYLKDGSRFVQLIRYSKRVNMVIRGYFEKIQQEGYYTEYEFRYSGQQAFIRPKSSKKKKPKWELMGYFAALTDFVAVKEMTFVNVKRVFLDEAVIDKNDIYHDYLPNEIILAANCVDSCTREIPGQKRAKPYFHALGNATDINSPWLQLFNIFYAPEPGFHKIKVEGKTWLLHYDSDKIYADKKASETLAGRMLLKAGSQKDIESNVYNAFEMDSERLFEKKPSDAVFILGLVWDDKKIGFYSAYPGMWVGNIPKNSVDVYTLKASEVPNYRLLPRIKTDMRAFWAIHCDGRMTYKNPQTWSAAKEMWKFLGFMQ